MVTLVLSNNIQQTREWLVNDIIGRENFSVATNSLRELRDKKSNKWIIINEFRHIDGLIYQNVIRDPNYFTLEEYAKARIK